MGTAEVICHLQPSEFDKEMGGFHGGSNLVQTAYLPWSHCCANGWEAAEALVKCRGSPVSTCNSLGWEVKMLLLQMDNTKLSVSPGAAPALLAFLELIDTAKNI